MTEKLKINSYRKTYKLTCFYYFNTIAYIMAYNAHYSTSNFCIIVNYFLRFACIEDQLIKRKMYLCKLVVL